jgi:hypothetical protein
MTSPNIYVLKLCSIYKILWHLDSFISRDSIFGLAGRRAGTSFFAPYLDYFIVTQNSQPLPGLGTVTQLHRDPWLRIHLPGLAKNAAPRLRRYLIKPPGRYASCDPKKWPPHLHLRRFFLDNLNQPVYRD